MNKLSSKKRKKITVFLCCFLILLCFAYTVFIRRARFKMPLDSYNSGWCTAHSVCVTKNWIKEGAFNLRFMHVLNPASIEFDTLLSREPCVSYPPGTFIIVFLLAKILHIKDLIMLYQIYNLFNQLTISLLLFFIMFQIINYFGNINIFTIFFSIMPSITYLYLPPTLHWHQDGFFADQAVIMLFVIFIYLEMKYLLYGRLGAWSKLFFLSIVFLGMLTEWLFAFVVFVAFILRILFVPRVKGGLKNLIIMNLNLIIPALLALAFFIYQVIPMGLLSTLITHYRNRTAGTGEDGVAINLFNQHFRRFGSWYYGKTLCLCAVASIIAFLLYYAFMRLKAIRSNINKLLNKYMYLICLSVLPCLLQVYVF
ncbi:MAG TPA: hypothetical protein VMD04_02565, partial [Candidatus Margulisiibacteriota bacterium]|nr:hypothetical protein [Candidatus Margulisiibacteriota bacterium]